METDRQIIIISFSINNTQIMVSLKSPSKKSSFYISKGYDINLEKLSKKLKTDLDKGLSKNQVEKRTQSIGLNQIITPKPSVWKLYLAPLLTP